MGYNDGVDGDPCKFAIFTNEGDQSEIYSLSTTSEDGKKEWVSALKTLVQSQTAFAFGM